MPYTKKQNHLFRAVEHGWQPPEGSGIHISQHDAAKMAAEGVKETPGKAGLRRGLSRGMAARKR